MAIKSFLCGTDAPSNGNDAMTWIFVGLLVVLVILLLVVPMFTNKKRAKQTTELHNSLKPGDVIKTVGGIIGTIKEIRKISPSDTEMIIETGDGDNATTMTFDIQALYQILTRSDNAVSTSAPESSDVFDETAAKTEDAVAVEEKAAAEPEKQDDKVEEKVEEKTEEPVKEQTAAAEEVKAEEVPSAPNDAEPQKAKATTAHKPVQKKKSGTSASAKKPTKK